MQASGTDDNSSCAGSPHHFAFDCDYGDGVVYRARVSSGQFHRCVFDLGHWNRKRDHAHSVQTVQVSVAAESTDKE